jgi:hypothetical protein
MSAAEELSGKTIRRGPFSPDGHKRAGQKARAITKKENCDRRQAKDDVVTGRHWRLVPILFGTAFAP